MRAVKSLLVVGCLAPTVSLAGDHAYVGAGTTTCGHFVGQHLATDDLLKQPFLAWAQGFLTAENLAHQDHVVVELPEPDTILAFMQKYCTDHPLDTYMGGVLELYKALLVRQMRAQPSTGPSP